MLICMLASAKYRAATIQLIITATQAFGGQKTSPHIERREKGRKSSVAEHEPISAKPSWMNKQNRPLNKTFSHPKKRRLYTFSSRLGEVKDINSFCSELINWTIFYWQ